MSRRNSHLPVEALRPKFWEVAHARPEEPYLTPFHRERCLEQITDYEMAEKVGMTLEAYQRMESGKGRAQPCDLLSFCDAINCHPLDLYVEPWGGVPLPREIFETLLMIVQEQGYDRDYMGRTHARLNLEKHHAITMLEGNLGDLTPLLIAFGASPDMKEWNTPLYQPTDFSKIHKSDLPAYATQALIDEDIQNPRVYIDNCLNAYELELEKTARSHERNLRAFLETRARNEQILQGTALQLYGPQGYKTALSILAKWVGSTDDREAVRDRYLEDLSKLCQLTPENISIWNAGGIEAENLRLKGQVLFKSATIHDRNEKLLQSGEMEKASLNSARALVDFRYWRNSPRTQRLFDWLENWVTLDRLDKNGSGQPPWLIIPGSFPFTPG